MIHVLHLTNSVNLLHEIVIRKFKDLGKIKKGYYVVLIRCKVHRFAIDKAINQRG